MLNPSASFFSFELPTLEGPVTGVEILSIATWDSYAGRESVVQDNEQSTISLLLEGSSVWSFTTEDLEDNIESARWEAGPFNASSADTITFTHVGGEGTGSHHIRVCVRISSDPFQASGW